jgi:hypothetical protein
MGEDQEFDGQVKEKDALSCEARSDDKRTFSTTNAIVLGIVA